MGGDLVREARRRAGLTQAELARRAGTTQSAIARLEAGRSSPSFDTVVRLLRLCGFRLDVGLDPYDDSDIAQAERLLLLSPDERVDSNAAVVAFAADLREAYERAVDG
jgi:transcriptional regulator with XRE-family HTH domain